MTSDAIRALRTQLDGAIPPEGLTSVLTEEQLHALAAAIGAARTRQAAELETSIRRALAIVPAPLRPSVRRIVFQESDPA